MSKAPSHPKTPYSPPPYILYSVCSLLIHTGKGGEITTEKLEGKKFTKLVENINMTDCISSL